jgi:hypothetical protein
MMKIQTVPDITREIKERKTVLMLLYEIVQDGKLNIF